MTAGENEELETRARYRRIPLGAIHVVSLFEGTAVRSTAGYILNASQDEVDAAFARLGFPAGKVVTSFSAMAVEAGSELIVIDAGFGAAGSPSTGLLGPGLRLAGHRPEDVDTVLISHFHKDHIAGLLDAEGGPAFPNATIKVPGPEWRYWMADSLPAGASGQFAERARICRDVFVPLADRIERFEWGDSVAEGIIALAAPGHTPGHTAFDIRSGDERLLYLADVTNNPLVFARAPHWQAAFDSDGDQAVRTRMDMLSMAADQSPLVFFYHAPFPAFGHIRARGERFEFVPIEHDV